MKNVLFALISTFSLGCNRSETKVLTEPYRPEMTFVCTKSPDISSPLVAVGFYEGQNYPNSSYRTTIWPITSTAHLREGDRVRLFRYTPRKKSMYTVQTGNEECVLNGRILAVAVRQ